jgi:hypothetical protein
LYPHRSEAIRRLVELGLKAKGNRPAVVHTCDDRQALMDDFRASAIAFAFRLRLASAVLRNSPECGIIFLAKPADANHAEERNVEGAHGFSP